MMPRVIETDIAIVRDALARQRHVMDCHRPLVLALEHMIALVEQMDGLRPTELERLQDARAVLAIANGGRHQLYPPEIDRRSVEELYE